MRISDWSSDVCSSDLPLEDLLHHVLGCCIARQAPGKKAQKRLAKVAMQAVESQRFARLMKEVGASDRQRLDEYFTSIRQLDRKSTRLNSSHSCASRMPSSA